ncbi:MAG TPA: hypothetical protein VMM36_02095, partial [Opitutaceae bacterium]|nr:hypothetical protein [Opitutaceae bacterium]
MHAPALISSLVRPAAAGVLMLSVATCGALADVVTDWNTAMTNYVTPLSPVPLAPFVETRVYAMAHIAMFNAIDDATRKKHGTASADAAGAQAARDVLVHEFPGGTSAFDALLATGLAAIPDGPAKTQGIVVGANAAAAMLAARANDGSATPPPPYIPGTEPG